jgi:hypothetical protein
MNGSEPCTPPYYYLPAAISQLGFHQQLGLQLGQTIYRLSRTRSWLNARSLATKLGKSLRARCYLNLAISRPELNPTAVKRSLPYDSSATSA